MEINASVNVNNDCSYYTSCVSASLLSIIPIPSCFLAKTFYDVYQPSELHGTIAYRDRTAQRPRSILAHAMIRICKISPQLPSPLSSVGRALHAEISRSNRLEGMTDCKSRLLVVIPGHLKRGVLFFLSSFTTSHIFLCFLFDCVIFSAVPS
ncbi:uncharacterized protein EV420DRAFT_150237 [Desarmillaria tabescens]|uniref:Uncharacterized protein n=1 Tax=Armillaria tabescens TaxID=1929756 RepID=A0AA39JBA6_ARMTA|nr:uncharacterized protein EV420DRAFT_150237 [Desarmillaria tabescens]KAK0438189.1 hypothetical protein EV420DRAFT_150237 [Desarmillaria tabescens]